MRHALTTALLGATLATAGTPAGAAAPRPQVTDPRGDANGLDGRQAGAPAPHDVVTPVSEPSYDVTSVHWYADAAAVYGELGLVAAPDPATRARYVMTFATPTCATGRILWVSDWDGAVLLGCKPAHGIALSRPRWDGDGLVFRIPRTSLRRWFAAGTELRGLGAETCRYADVGAGAAYPIVDGARGDTPYRLGD